jgi:hypothetical protein
MTQAAQARPWYRELWPWLLMLPPAASVVGGVTMVYLAVSTPSALVVTDYSRIEEITSERYALDRRAAELRLSARLALEGAGTLVLVNVALAQASGVSAPPALQLRLQHASNSSADRELVLTGRGGEYRGATDLAAGRYDVELLPPDRAWRLGGSIGGAPAAVELEPPGVAER